MSDKKKFKDTKLGGWLSTNAPKVLDVVGDLLPDQGALGVVKNLIQNDPDLEPSQKAEFARIAFELESADRASARQREVEVVKATGKIDWMMVITGIVGLLSFMFTIYAVVYIESVKENELFIHRYSRCIYHELARDRTYLRSPGTIQSSLVRWLLQGICQ
jgi:hypothetical protein